ncbi:MAG: RNA methyltransferase [Deltaproteobacteria bacterium]|nr:RNA methyltransferase [Deltaproteobacteria bacterium]
MAERINRDNIAVVLVGPRLPENIGAAARAMNNMDIRRLIIVNPGNMDRERIAMMATSHSIDILENMKIHDDLREALAPFRYIAGTTARVGSMRPALTTPKDLARDLIPISKENDIAILFGPEDRGLSNSHLSYCHTIINIPTSEFSSLNLAQAVMIVCYELFQATGDEHNQEIPRLANSFELEGMYDHMKKVLTRIGFINPQNPERWMWNIRRFLSRLPLQAMDVRVIRGIFRQIDWYVDQAVRKGKGE